MRSEHIDQRLADLHQASARISANLVDLEIDSGRQLLEATRLEGQSAARWAAASQALTELWRRHGLLESLLEQADELKGPRRADRLASLLCGRSIELASSEVPVVRRKLLASAEETERCSPDELLVSMSAAFEEVKTALTEIGSAWEQLVPAIDDARHRLRRANEFAAELDERDQSDLDAVGKRLNDLGARVTADPLSVDPDDVGTLAREINEIRSRLEADLALKRGFAPRILDAREALEQLGSLGNELRAAREELMVKIAVAGTAPPPPDDDGERDLTRISALAERGEWSQARAELDAWTERIAARHAEAERLLRASRVPIEARNQLRALLDAYRVKAKRLGLVEEAEIADAYTRAQASLYTAPTDLNVAAQLVRAYQEIVNGYPSSSEALL
jgi:DNA repair exonuclease SbcCD ATPase subunit